MIIICPCGEKKFEVESNLIPEKGRLLKCGSCDQTWFFNKNEQTNINSENLVLSQENEIDKISPKVNKKKEPKSKYSSNLANKNKGSELIKYETKTRFSFLRILNYLIVSLISFVAVIIILDTFKVQLSTFFPNLELILYNLFETLKDLVLFIKDLK